MYRAPRVKRQLEQALGDMPGVRRIDASILTGRVLIIFSPLIDLVDIATQIETLLDEKQQPALQPAASRTLPRYRFAGVLDSFSILLRELPSLFKPAPAFVSAARLHTDDTREVPEQEIRSWHLLGLQEVIDRLGAAPKMGLGAEEVERRLQQYGYNSLQASRGRSDLAIFLGQFNSPPVYLLGASAAIAVITGGVLDAAVILGVVLINSAIGFITERQAEKTIAALTKSGVRSVHALRDGQQIQILVENIVPGDILLLSPGTYVAADARILNSHRLSVDESALTG